jgi:ABC-type multidrug transport system ATPase subunit
MTADPGRAVIELDSVDKFFGQTPAVLDLSFKVMEGEIVALLGRTGAGKSTALHMIMGVMEPTRGTVRVEGLDPFNQFNELRGKLSVSFQTDRLLPWRSAWENVALGLEILGHDKKSQRRQAIEWLENVKSSARRTSPSTRTSCPAVCASASRSPARCASIRHWCYSTRAPASSTTSPR